MVTIRAGFAKQNKKSPFNQDILQKRLIELRKNDLMDLFSNLECNNPEHINHENSITVLLDPNEEQIIIDKICCKTMEEKIKAIKLK